MPQFRPDALIFMLHVFATIQRPPFESMHFQRLEPSRRPYGLDAVAERMVNIALGNTQISDCTAGDANGDQLITVDEILQAVNNALNGCG